MSRRNVAFSALILIGIFCFSCLSGSAQAQVPSDFNGDGKSDILWRNISTGDVDIWEMNGLSILNTGAVYQGLPLQWQVAGVGDFNGDGKSDILWRNVGTGDVVLWEMNGFSRLNSGTIYQGLSLDWQVVGVGDFNGDKKADILWRNVSTGDVDIWEMNGFTTLASNVIYSGLSLQWQVAGVGDFNGDGKSDILWRNVGTGDVVLWEMNGFSRLNSGTIYQGLSLDWQVVGVGDFNGDKKADILWRNTSAGDVAIWEMNGLSILNTGTVYQGLPLQWQVSGVGNYNGEATSDILWYDAGTGDVVVWEMNGASIQNRGDVYQAVPLQWQIVHPIRKVYGLNFSPYVYSGQNPNLGTDISYTQLVSLLSNIAPYTTWVRTFGSTNGLENIGAVAHSFGLKTAIGAYLDGVAADNSAQIAGLVQQANAGDVDVAIVGTEDLYRGDETEAQLLAYISQVRQQIPKSVKVTYVDTWSEIVAHPNIIAAVDIVAVTIYPFYEQVPITQALAQLQSDYQNTVNVAVGKPVWIAETGWPSQGNLPSAGSPSLPSPANAATYFAQAEEWARSAGIPLFYFESYDEPWKANYNDYPSWGIWDVNSNLKAGMNVPFQ